MPNQWIKMTEHRDGSVTFTVSRDYARLVAATMVCAHSDQAIQNRKDEIPEAMAWNGDRSYEWIKHRDQLRDRAA